MPKINPLADGESYTEDGVMYNAYYTSPFYYFIDLEFPGLTISEDGEYPSGIYGRQEGTNYGSQGKATSKTQENKTMVITVTTPATVYDAAIQLKFSAIFGAIQGPFDFNISTDTTIPGLGKGKPMEKVIVSDGLSGGTGDFSWVLSNAPEGLVITVDTDKRKAWIEGTPTKITGSGYATIQITDNKTNIQRTDKIFYDGVYEPMTIKMNKISVPSLKGGEAITTIDLNDCFEGGEEPFKYEDTDNIFKDRGLEISTMGIVSGAVADVAKPAATGNITIKDMHNQQVVIQVEFGEIKGNLNFDKTASGVIASIPSKDVNTTLATDLLPNLENGAVGGEKPYSFKVSPDNGPSNYGFTVTLNAATGKFTQVVYPSEPRNTGSFDIILTDKLNASVTIPISFGEVTEAP